MSSDVIGRPMEILLVEDSLTAARLSIRTLQKSGIKHRLSWLRDGMEAKRYVFQDRTYSCAPRPDIILLDLNLPHLHGKELLSLIRQSPLLKNIPVIIMTGEPGEHGVDEFQDLEVQGFLVKPINPKEFQELVQKLKGYWKADMIIPSEIKTVGY